MCGICGCINFKDQIKMLVEWYQFYNKNKKYTITKSIEQINVYRNLVFKKKCQPQPQHDC